MITNYAKLAYNTLQNVDINEPKNKVKGKGLLTPVKNTFSKNTDDFSKEPAYRVAKYLTSIRNIRLELNGNADENT